jgi:hypothetical protein
MANYLEFELAPIEEDCAQVGDIGYSNKARLEENGYYTKR